MSLFTRVGTVFLNQVTSALNNAFNRELIATLETLAAVLFHFTSKTLSPSSGSLMQFFQIDG